MLKQEPFLIHILIAIGCLVLLMTNMKPVSAFLDPISIAPTLPLSDINVIIVTDVHSWVGGHVLPPNHNQKINNDNHDPSRRTADYGDVLSFVEHLKNYIYSQPSYPAEEERDVWFVMNGDWIDGTGLAMNGNADSLIPILERMPFDAVTVGNHELYQNLTIQQMTKPAGLIEFLGHRYVSSNVMRADRHDRSIGNLYTILRGRSTNVLVLGFLYEMIDADKMVQVQSVHTVVQSTWFQAIVKNTDQYHAILVLAHMDVRDPLLQIILSAIRKLAGSDMPVQFITGHTHHRDVEVLDQYCTSVEAGRYLDTVGFVSFPSTKHEAARRQRSLVVAGESTQVVILDDTDDDTTNNNIPMNITNKNVGTSPPEMTTPSIPSSSISNAATPTLAPVAAMATTPAAVVSALGPASKFDHVFIDATPAALKEALGMAAEFELKTAEGEDLTRFIQQIRLDLNLDRVIGWTCDTYLLYEPISSPTSLWGFFQRQIVPTQATARNQVVLLEGGAWRYDALYEGDVRLDDVIGISPFNTSFVVLKNVEMAALLEFNTTFNAAPNVVSGLPNYVLSFADPDTTFEALDVYVDSFEAQSIIKALQGFSSATIEPPNVTNITTTSIWLDYFAKEGYNYCKTQGKDPPPSHFDKKHPFGESGGGGGAEDVFEASFGAVAIAIVLVLCAAMVRLKGVLSQQKSSAKEFIVLQAQLEYDESFHQNDVDLSEDEEYITEGNLL